MMRKIFILAAIVLTACLYGCKKKSSQSEPVVKSEAEYKAAAKKEISTENMEAELDKIEKQLEQEVSAEQ